MNGRPNDERKFLHKKIFGAISTVSGLLPIPGGNIISKITGALSGGGGSRGFGRRRRTPAPPPVSVVPVTTVFPGSQQGPPPMPIGFAPPTRLPQPSAFGGIPPGASGGACKSTETSRCCQLRTGDFRDQAKWQQECGTAGEQFDDEFGPAVEGAFGMAGLTPAFRSIATRKCPRGTVLGTDGLCYNRKSIRNSDREWPRGTRPLLTGGEMRCIRIASQAAGRLKTKEKQLRKMGMLPALPRRGGRKALPPGHHEHVAHN